MLCAREAGTFLTEGLVIAERKRQVVCVRVCAFVRAYVCICLRAYCVSTCARACVLPQKQGVWMVPHDANQMAFVR